MIGVLGLLEVRPVQSQPNAPLLVGFAEADITPALGAKPVYLAGFGQNRKATAILDPLKVRTIVLRNAGKTVAIAVADVVGLFLPTVEHIRSKLPNFDYVLISCTHNHHGPDTMGLWGASPFSSGADAEYQQRLESAAVQAIRDAEKSLQPATAQIGSISCPQLLHDSRPPMVKHEELITLQFRDPTTAKTTGIVVQWNCHPETLDSKNTRISSDFVGATVQDLQARHQCPVVYITGTVGGLMTSMHVDVQDERGNRLPEGSAEKAHRYGKLLAAKASESLSQSRPIRLTPLAVRSRAIVLPVDNRLFVAAKAFKVIDRPIERWMGQPIQHGKPADGSTDRGAIRSETAYCQFGELSIAVIPGEIYPELVLGKVQDPADPAADFPNAPIEPAIYLQMPGPYRMIVGLGNDELGYILPKRQWDEKPPFTYGQKKAPYGEVNSLGPETAPLLCEAFRDLLKSTESR